MADRKKCFVITPIGNETDPIRRHIDGIIEAVIVPALGSKYDVVVAHKITTPGPITKQVISEIYSADLVIANLTDRNPNVMYELAFRHSLGKPVIMIAEAGTALPSDIIMERTIFYRNDAAGVLELRTMLIKTEQDLDFERIGSPIYDVIHEIDAEAKILKASAEATSDGISSVDSISLQFILNKLDRIEERLQKESPFAGSNFSNCRLDLVGSSTLRDLSLLVEKDSHELPIDLFKILFMNRFNKLEQELNQQEKELQKLKKENG